MKFGAIFFCVFLCACSRSGEPPSQQTSLPSVTSFLVTAVSATTASCGGTVISDGGDSVTDRGVCWSTNPSPNIANSLTKNGSGKGDFFSSLTGLSFNTTYYVRAYATNKNGTAYSSQVQFLTLRYITIAGDSTGALGSTANLLALPAGVFVDSLGYIYVSDQGNKRVQKFLPGTKNATTVAGGNGAGPNANQITAPTGIFVDKSGNLYVADGANHRVQKWVPGASAGVTVAGTDGYLLNKGVGKDQLNNPWGIFVDDSANIYIADAVNNRIQKWAPNAKKGTTVAGDSSGMSGATLDKLNFPQGVYVDKTGNIYIADAGNNRIQKWAPAAKVGTTVAGGQGSGKGANQLWSPSSIFIDGNGSMFIGDYGNFRVQRWEPGATSGVTVAGGNGFGKNANQLYSPVSVVVDKVGNIFIAEDENNRIQKWAQ